MQSIELTIVEIDCKFPGVYSIIKDWLPFNEQVALVTHEYAVNVYEVPDTVPLTVYFKKNIKIKYKLDNDR